MSPTRDQIAEFKGKLLSELGLGLAVKLASNAACSLEWIEDKLFSSPRAEYPIHFARRLASNAACSLEWIEDNLISSPRAEYT